MIAVNDISFLKGFDKKNDARKALIQFGNIGLQLRSERVSKVNGAVDIVNSNVVHKTPRFSPAACPSSWRKTA